MQYFYNQHFQEQNPKLCDDILWGLEPDMALLSTECRIQPTFFTLWFLAIVCRYKKYKNTTFWKKNCNIIKCGKGLMALCNVSDYYKVSDTFCNS